MVLRSAAPVEATGSAMQTMLPTPKRILRVLKDTQDTCTLELETGEGGFCFAPGQFNMLYAFGKGEVPISISGDPQRPERLVHTVRAVGAVSRSLTAMKKGQMLGVRGPFGTHWPVERAETRDVVIVAGGIGLAPLRPALYALLAARERYGRIVLLYGARTPGDLLYRHELQRWRGRFDLEVEVTVDSSGGDWRGHVGVVTTLLGRAEFDPHFSLAMVCGPEIMMRFAVRELLDGGMNPAAVYVSMERNMKCAVGHCGHCQFGAEFVCKDGPVFPFERIADLIGKAEI